MRDYLGQKLSVGDSVVISGEGSLGSMKYGVISHFGSMKYIYVNCKLRIKRDQYHKVRTTQNRILKVNDLIERG